jgi:AmiR/NasT family two-component response regulator
MIMASMHCDENEAFAILKTQSQAQNIKVRDIAEEIVRNASRS